MKRKRFGLFGEKNRRSGRTAELSPAAAAVTDEAERIKEAAENYRLAPMNVKRYYLSLYYTFLHKYGNQLKHFGRYRETDPFSEEISLYQNVEHLFEELYCDLMRLACAEAGENRGA